MSSGSHFILLEGVNVLDHMYDTDQLSVIRGTSALFKSAITDTEKEFSDSDNRPEGILSAVSTGASSGLFLLTEGRPEKMLAAISTYLSQHQYYRHLTFQLQSCEASSLKQAQQRLWGQLRIAQLQDFTLMPDWEGTEPDDALGEGVCELEGRRIASQGRSSKVQGDREKSLSASVYSRLIYGRDQREAFYERELSNQPEVWSSLMSALHAQPASCFASDFNELCTDTEQKYPQSLQNKMAVIYLDGNHFGKRQGEFVDEFIKNNSAADDLALEIKAQQAFDSAIKKLRARFLAGEIKRHLEAQANGGVIPLETLMWGGDEMLLVMPAWEGFDFLQRFFAFDWNLSTYLDSSDKELPALTHAAGIVFCQANKPIRIIQKLAHDLAERVKDSDGGRENDAWDYLVLESVDYPTDDDMSEYFNTRYTTAIADGREKKLPAIRDWETTVREKLLEAKRKGYLTTSQLYLLADTILKDSEATDAPEVTVSAKWSEITSDKEDIAQNASPQIKAERRMYQVSENKAWLKNSLPALAKSLFDYDFDDAKKRVWFWFHLIELWDYQVIMEEEK
ncbi:MAG: hypothetical protein CSB47_10915 [Proteobacteria bacterium]|nr:MAG: hypothetical protein CSB47_10915 [Pseudomonadota bacterium]